MKKFLLLLLTVLLLAACGGEIEDKNSKPIVEKFDSLPFEMITFNNLETNAYNPEYGLLIDKKDGCQYVYVKNEYTNSSSFDFTERLGNDNQIYCGEDKENINVTNYVSFEEGIGYFSIIDEKNDKEYSVFETTGVKDTSLSINLRQ